MKTIKIEKCIECFCESFNEITDIKTVVDEDTHIKIQDNLRDLLTTVIKDTRKEEKESLKKRVLDIKEKHSNAVMLGDWTEKTKNESKALIEASLDDVLTVLK